MRRNKDWSIGGILTLLEQYNGLGYASRGCASPYIWSGTDQYVAGKYVADHVFDPSTVDRQIGAAGHSTASGLGYSETVDCQPGVGIHRRLALSPVPQSRIGAQALLISLLVLAFVLVYVLIARPMLKQRPMLSAAFKAEASQRNAIGELLARGLFGFSHTSPCLQLASRENVRDLSALRPPNQTPAGVLVAFHDEVLSFVTGQDWTSLTSRLPPPSWHFDERRQRPWETRDASVVVSLAAAPSETEIDTAQIAIFQPCRSPAPAW